MYDRHAKYAASTREKELMLSKIVVVIFITFVYLYLCLCLFQPIGTTMFWTVSISVPLSFSASPTGSLIIITSCPRRLDLINTAKQLSCKKNVALIFIGTRNLVIKPLIS